MLKELLKTGVKKTLPSLLDSIGIYDNTIDNGEHKLIVPMYHRIITDKSIDPFNLGMCIRRTTFEKQLDYFSNNYNSIGLYEYCKSNSVRLDNNNYISLTFDDGYKDNIQTAVPLLKKYNIDATFFICCSILTDNKEFWWDIIINAFSNSVPKDVNIESSPIKLTNETFTLTERNKKRHCKSILDDLWNISDISLIYETAYYIEDILIGHRQKIEKLDEHDIRKLHENGFEVAAHSLTHPNMNIISMDMQLEELEKSKNILEDIIGDKVNGFAYPAGYQNPNLISLLKKTGYEYAVGTEKGVNKVFDKYKIQRFGVAESSVSDMKRSIYNYCRIKYNK